MYCRMARPFLVMLPKHGLRLYFDLIDIRTVLVQNSWLLGSERYAFSEKRTIPWKTENVYICMEELNAVVLSVKTLYVYVCSVT